MIWHGLQRAELGLKDDLCFVRPLLIVQTLDKDTHFSTPLTKIC